MSFNRCPRWIAALLEAPFALGAEVSGHINIRGYEHVTLTIWIETMEPYHSFLLPLASLRH